MNNDDESDGTARHDGVTRGIHFI